jgi:hypothetical protein
MLHHPLLGWVQCCRLQLMVLRAVAEFVVDVEAALTADRRRVDHAQQESATIIDLAAYRRRVRAAPDRRPQYVAS